MGTAQCLTCAAPEPTFAPSRWRSSNPSPTGRPDSLALEHRTTVLVAPRQSGKSRSLAVAALWWAYSRPDQRVLIVSAGEDASRRLLAQAAAVAVRSPLLAGSVVDENSDLLVLSNGSEVRSVPASERAVRGWTVDLLLVDESAQVDDDLLLGAAIPTTAARPDARIVLAGSPGDVVAVGGLDPAPSMIRVPVPEFRLAP